MAGSPVDSRAVLADLIEGVADELSPYEDPASRLALQTGNRSTPAERA